MHSSPISGIATKDNYVATAGYDNNLILWEAARSNAIASASHDHLVNQCTFSHNGQLLLSSSSDYTVRLWSVPELHCLAIFSFAQDDTEGVAFHPSDKYIIFTSRDHNIYFCDIEGNLIHILKGHKQDVLSVSWLNDEIAISSSDDGTIKRWSPFTGELLSSTDLKGVETDTIAIKGDECIFSGNDKGEIHIFENDEISVIKAHNAGIKRLLYSQEFSQLISLSYDRYVAIWQVSSNNDLVLIKKMPYPYQIWARSCDFQNENSLVVSTFGSSYAKLNIESDSWDLTNVMPTSGINAICKSDDDIFSVGDAGTIICRSVNGKKHKYPLSDVPSLCNFIIKVDQFLLVGGQTGTVYQVSGEVVTSVYQHHSPINCAIKYVNNECTYVAIGTYTGDIVILKINGATLNLYQLIQAHDNAIKSIATSQNFIYSVSANCNAAFHSIHDFNCVKRLEGAHDKIINGCTYYQDDKFVSVSRDLTLRLTSLTEQSIINTPHKHSIKCIAISDDKKFIATGGYYGDIYIYHLDSGLWQYFRPCTSGISCMIYNADQKCFLASSYNGNIYDVELESINCTADLL
ncbi:hypothetical protein [Cysteiniphilum sp. QT6929]|uniref:WD40 repeat domain-containing protein n=1 Tax=Cysteiniphilum sp. QT6929 TaxID=2975055 RepID=UPI0024B34643|nr:hypothetical protein [Cysteiniphilum sp. QT6929]WHN65913.1 hypothetical protein NYP54_01430 [Cysteiniphilum sp. QT6929]